MLLQGLLLGHLPCFQSALGPLRMPEKWRGVGWGGASELGPELPGLQLCPAREG